jgi:hypothetical protein
VDGKIQAINKVKSFPPSSSLPPLLPLNTARRVPEGASLALRYLQAMGHGYALRSQGSNMTTAFPYTALNDMPQFFSLITVKQK